VGFGKSVSIWGDYAVVGAGSSTNAGLEKAGLAYVYKRSDDLWSLHATLSPDDPAASVHFGKSVAIYEDTIAVGASGANDNGSYSGAVYIFVRNGDQWIQETRFIGQETGEYDYFGDPIAIHGDNLIVGTRYDDDQGSEAGAAYFFKRTGSTWTQKAKVTAHDGYNDGDFGRSVSIFGEKAVVGADNYYGTYSNAGVVYLFELINDKWRQTAKILASDGVSGDYFGRSVSITNDKILVGAIGADNGVSGSGAAYQYELACVEREAGEIDSNVSSHNFSDVYVGRNKVITVTLTNSGIGPLEIDALSIGGDDAADFSIIEDGCISQSIAVDGQCTFKVVFEPQSSGAKSVSLTILSSDPNNSQVTIPLSGNALAPTAP
ncbi:MAG: choice-of-anchor D domain-containing protein, partial [Planctomycetes bacterium]|nr:choice-of-anchor D domain-containing protein [Planctomycetota bacterium]